VNQYWERISEAEKGTLLVGRGGEHWLQYTEVAWDRLRLPTDEAALRRFLDIAYMDLHNTILLYPNLDNNHATIIPLSGGFHTVGDPDYLFIERDKMYAIMEAKTFWKLSPEHITDLLSGIALICLIDLGRDSCCSPPPWTSRR
jgi:hypothetical protein